MGGKAKVAAKIADYLNSIRRPGQSYIEPFCGACSVMARIDDSGPRIAADAHPDLILLWQSLQQGWTPPARVSERKHRRLRRAAPSALRAFVGFGCSYGGKFFGGYARAKKAPRGYAREARNSILKKLSTLKSVTFHHKSYLELPPPIGALIYCDPPYAGTEGFKGIPKFDHEQFWTVMRFWSRSNPVIISEAQAPDDFAPVLKIEAPRGLRKGPHAKSGKPPRREFLFRHKSQCDPRGHRWQALLRQNPATLPV